MMVIEKINNVSATTLGYIETIDLRDYLVQSLQRTLSVHYVVSFPLRATGRS